jgi:hypothetical protein
MGSVDEQRAVRMLTLEEWAPLMAERGLCSGCFENSISAGDELCPTCKAQDDALESFWDIRQELIDAAEDFHDNVRQAILPWRLEAPHGPDVPAARERLLAAQRALLQMAQDALDRFGPAVA